MSWKGSFLKVWTRCFASSTGQPKLVLGCGSNVVDQFFMVQGIKMVYGRVYGVIDVA